jgi:hypothetical protein
MEMDVMKTRWLLPVLLLGLGIALFNIPTTAAEKSTDAEVAKLIKQLGSDEFAVREAATESLDKIGLPALPALRKAAKDGDAEISRRAEELVSRIEKRGETAAILAPKKVKLSFKGTPVPQAVDELRKQSGYNIVLQDPKNVLKDRKVTLDTGEVSFWEALDRLCEKAELIEDEPTIGRGTTPPGIRITPTPGAGPGAAPGAPGIKLEIEVRPLEAKPAAKTLPAREKGKVGLDEKAEKPADKTDAPKPAGRPAIGLPAIGVVAKPGPGFRPIMNVPDQITLTDGKPAKLSTDYSSAIRIRALTKSDAVGKAAPGHILLALQATPEPKIKWQNLVQVKINKAIDDQGQTLEQTAIALEKADPAKPGAGPVGGPTTLPALPIARPVYTSTHQNIPVQFKKGAKESKSLKELSGVITAQVLAPAKAFITVDDVMKAAGKTINGTEGGSIKILDVSKDKAGNITIRFELEAPAGITPASGTGGPVNTLPTGVTPLPAPTPTPRGAKPALRGALAADDAPAPAPAPGAKIALARVEVVAVPNYRIAGLGDGLTLCDAKGNPIAVSFGRQVQIVDGKIKQTMIYTVPAASAEPAKLTFMGQKPTTIDIPFTLKNVTLP